MYVLYQSVRHADGELAAWGPCNPDAPSLNLGDSVEVGRTPTRLKTTMGSAPSCTVKRGTLAWLTWVEHPDWTPIVIHGSLRSGRDWWRNAIDAHEQVGASGAVRGPVAM